MGVTTKTIIDYAISQIGTKESPAGSNKVKYNTWYYGKEVSGNAYPWCGVFVCYVFNKCNASNLFYDGKKCAYCPTIENYYKSIGRYFSNGEPGDLCVMDFGRTLLRYLDEINHDLKVFVVKSCIDTFDAPGHNREEWLEIAYKVLEQAGAVVVEDVEDLKGKVKQLIK